MRRLSIVFVLFASLVAFGQQSPKHCSTKSPCGPTVRVDQVRTDDDGLTVWMSSPTTVYVLTCSIKQKTCLTPATDTDYELIDGGEKLSVLKDFYGAYPHAPTVGLVDSGDVGIYALVRMDHRTTKKVAQ
jgi:hypothetical protein